MSGSLTRRDVLGATAAVTAAALIGAGANAAANEAGQQSGGFSEAEIQKLVEVMNEERQAWIEGRFDPERPASTMVQAEDMTIFGPFGGPVGVGSPQLNERQRQGSAQFGGGTGRHELVRAFQSGDMVVLVMNEWNEVNFPGRAEPCSWNLRTTQVFRRDGDKWIRLHRHADPLHERRSLDETLDLFQCK